MTTYAIIVKESFRVSISSPLGCKAVSEILEIQESLIKQGLPEAKRVPGRNLTLDYITTVIWSANEDVGTILQQAIKDSTKPGLAFMLGEVRVQAGYLVISIRGRELKGVQNHLKYNCKCLKTAHSFKVEHLGSIKLFEPYPEALANFYTPHSQGRLLPSKDKAN